MKRMICLFLSLMLCVVCVSPLVIVSADAKWEWTRDNAVAVSVKTEYIDAVLENVDDAFAYPNPAAVYITELRRSESLELLLILHQSGKKYVQDAIEMLSSDSRVGDAIRCYKMPFESVNTLRLSSVSETIFTGETTAIKQVGELDIYDPMIYSIENCYALPKDLNKDYTVQDFPTLSLDYIFRTIALDPFIQLKLTEPDYFNYIHVS